MSQTQEDFRTAINRILRKHGHLLTSVELQALIVGIMQIVVNDSANAVSHCTTDVANHPATE